MIGVVVISTLTCAVALVAFRATGPAMLTPPATATVIPEAFPQTR